VNPLNGESRVAQSLDWLLDSHDSLPKVVLDTHFCDVFRDEEQHIIFSYTQFVASDRTRYGVFAVWKLIDDLWEVMEFRTGEMR